MIGSLIIVKEIVSVNPPKSKCMQTVLIENLRSCNYSSRKLSSIAPLKVIVASSFVSFC